MFGSSSLPRARVWVVPFDLSDRHELLGWLVQALAKAIDADVSVFTGFRTGDDCYDRARGQYNAHLLLKHLGSLPGRGPSLPERDFILGLTSVDLFAPVFKFLMGEALLHGHTAVLSTYRLAPELYGLPADSELLQGRILKAAIHELGHCSGLVHCFETECAMRSASSVEDIDLRSVQLCAGCTARMTASVTR